MCSLTVLEAKSPKCRCRCRQGSVPAKPLGEDLPLPCSARGGWLQEVLGLWPHHSLTSSSSSSLKSPPTFFLTRTLVLAFTAHLDNPGIAPPFKIIHLITSAKTFFSPKSSHIHRFWEPRTRMYLSGEPPCHPLHSS